MKTFKCMACKTPITSGDDMTLCAHCAPREGEIFHKYLGKVCVCARGQEALCVCARVRARSFCLRLHAGATMDVGPATAPCLARLWCFSASPLLLAGRW